MIWKVIYSFMALVFIDEVVGMAFMGLEPSKNDAIINSGILAAFCIAMLFEEKWNKKK